MAVSTGYRGAIAGCKAPFWGNESDGDTRRSTRACRPTDRTFEATEDTFACRFYQRLTNESPCNQYLPPKPCDQKSFPPRKVNKAVTEVIGGAGANAAS